jgi:hypothetical protein
MFGCRPYGADDVYNIEPSQTAFLVPLEGQTSSQGKFHSEEFLAKSLVPVKRVYVSQTWRKTGYLWISGEYIPSSRVIIVERKPGTREWTASEDNPGTAESDQALRAASKEGIALLARMNCSAQIDEADAPKFLFRYNNKPLHDVMDTDLRARVEANFVEICSEKTLDDILEHKGAIMSKVRNDVLPYFKDRGINITVLGLKGEFSFPDPTIAEAINKRFTEAKNKQTQLETNARLISKATADATAAKVMQSAQGEKYLKYQIELEKLKLQNVIWAKWDGSWPSVMSGGSNMLFQIPQVGK